MRVVFDLDGTLIDSAADIRGIANTVLAGEGAAPLDMYETRAFIGHGTDTFVARMRAARGLPDADHPRLLADFLSRYDGAVGLTVPYPGVPEALGALAARGHALGICTNKPIGPCRHVLEHLGLLDLFGTVLGGDSLPARKPDPAPLEAALDALGAGPAVYVGDSEVDAETAQRAGRPFLLFEGGYRHAEVAAIPFAASFADWGDLPALAARHAA